MTMDPPAIPAPEWAHLDNGRYEVTLSASGAGQSSSRYLALNRWRPDPVQDDWGFFLYLRDLDTGEYSSIGFQPVRTTAASYGFEQGDGWAALSQSWQGIESRLRLTLAEDAPLERRQLRLSNDSERPRRLEVTSYLEVSLFYADADAAHPAFAKLFVQTELDPDSGTLLARRRPRAAHEQWPCLAHWLEGATDELEWETDRLAFLGRGRTPASPQALHQPHLSGGIGNVLDPVLSLRTRIRLAPGEQQELTFCLGIADDPQQALTLNGGHRDAIRLFTPSATDKATPTMPPAPAELTQWNGYGGFDAEQNYRIHLDWQQNAHRLPPLPWINVIANPLGGCLISERGAGYTWFRNSQANRLTPWANDPVSDPHTEALYLRDPETGRFWSPLPGPAPAPADYRITHGLGFSRFEVDHRDWRCCTEIFMASEQPLRVLRLRLSNRSDLSRPMGLYSFQSLVLGNQPRYPSSIQTDALSSAEGLWARNPEAGPFTDGIAFSALLSPGQAPQQRSQSTDRLHFIGRHGDLNQPAALRRGGPLDGCTGSEDPCFALAADWHLAPGGELEVLILLGETTSAAEIDAFIAPYRQPGAAAQQLQTARQDWQDLVNPLQVETPEPQLNPLLNAWLPYQILSCRIWARSALYQSGGAYGFRDQLQDAANLLPLDPNHTRNAILRHAAHQFEAGDVCHWWHPEPLAHGLRTRFSDDLLWLPRVTAEYLRTTGDGDLLNQVIPFLKAEELPSGQDENYLPLVQSDTSADLYEHCCRALDRSLTCGEHGLPLMGSGDWNDGMNRIGHQGRGESVWMGFFLYQMLDDWISLCQQRRDEQRAQSYHACRQQLEQALNATGWDGDWYRRAYDDAGLPWGSTDNDECRIDALAQSWAVISGAAPPGRAEQAMDAVEQQLIDENAEIIRLLTPPFADTERDPGYIKGYVAGVRENGGQYSHAACWVVQAMALLGRRDRAMQLLQLMNPLRHCANPVRADRYKGEPYVIAADIYGTDPHQGRVGWTWYTGAAGWYYRVAVEILLGFRVESGDTLVLEPRIPDNWPGYGIRYALPHGGHLQIRVENPDQCAETIRSATLDGHPLVVQSHGLRLPLPTCSKEQQLQLILGPAKA